MPDPAKMRMECIVYEDGAGEAEVCHMTLQEASVLSESGRYSIHLLVEAKALLALLRAFTATNTGQPLEALFADSRCRRGMTIPIRRKPPRPRKSG